MYGKDGFAMEGNGGDMAPGEAGAMVGAQSLDGRRVT